MEIPLKLGELRDRDAQAWNQPADRSQPGRMPAGFRRRQVPVVDLQFARPLLLRQAGLHMQLPDRLAEGAAELSRCRLIGIRLTRV
jgi:hypothetical protein